MNTTKRVQTKRNQTSRFLDHQVATLTILHKSKKLVRLSLAERLTASREKRILEYRRRKVNEQRRKSNSGLAVIVESNEEDELENDERETVDATNNMRRLTTTSSYYSNLSALVTPITSPRSTLDNAAVAFKTWFKLPYIFTMCVSLQVLLSYFIGSWRG